MASNDQNLDLKAVQVQWVALLDQLIAEIAQWAREKGWLSSIVRKTINEDKLGAYVTHVLHLRSAQGQLIVEPVARFVAGAEGRVDILAFPSLHRFLLIREDGHWQLRTDAGVPWPEEWSREAFLKLAENLVAAP